MVDTACLGIGSASQNWFATCIGRLSVAAGTGPTNQLWQAAVACRAETLCTTSIEQGRALGPMHPVSARERWPFCVLRDSCLGAVPDQPEVAAYGLGTLKWWRSPPPTPLKHASNEPPVDSAGAGPCHVGVPLSDRNSVAQTPLCPVWAEMVLC